MHGYEPGSVTPTTELVLSHKHPDDYVQIAATLDEIRRTHQTFSTRHRIIDTHGVVHSVVVIGDQLYDDAGDVIGTHGFYVDVTPPGPGHEELISAAVAEIAENRAAIEQAKGMLMLVYRIDAEAAFDLLQMAFPGNQRQAAHARRAGAGRLRGADLRGNAATTRPPSTTCC